MKIAFDGTVLHGPKSGVGYYCEELLKAMLAVDHEDQFFVFSHERLKMGFQPANGNLRVTDSFRFPVRAFYLHALLPRILESVQPDLCHYTNFLAPISEHRPYVVTIHDMGMETLRNAHPLAKRLYTKRLVPHVARKARLIITNSEYSKWEIVKYLGIPEDRIRVTPLAASSEFRPTPSPHPAFGHPLPTGEGTPAHPYFLYVGNLEPRKNLERLIEAFARMPGKDHQLVIAGNRWFHGNAPEEKARSLGMNGRVRFLGYVPRQDLPALFSGATAFVYPSLLEGFGLPVIEAMACGTPVITSNNSSMAEVSGGAAVLVDPHDPREIADAMVSLAEDSSLRARLSKRGLARAAEFSWEKTARLTLETYRDAAGNPHPRPLLMLRPDGLALRGGVQSRGERTSSVAAAIRKTVEYAKLFQYPLTPDELRERLFDVEVDIEEFDAVVKSLRYRPAEGLMKVRMGREKISDEAIRDVQSNLRTLASMPFVRMLAFSGSTAHRNMTSEEDVDLFFVVEDGKLWAVFLAAMVWAKTKGLRKRLCMNYLISDAALPLFEHDSFTAQQAASLKPVYGKAVYDRFIEANPFVRRCFPNFNPKRHRDAYVEIKPWGLKRSLEALLRIGPVQLFERLSRLVLGKYLAKNIGPESDVQLDRRRLKLHVHSHKNAVLGNSLLDLDPHPALRATPSRGERDDRPMLLAESSRSSRETAS